MAYNPSTGVGGGGGGGGMKVPLYMILNKLSTLYIDFFNYEL